MVAPLSYNFVTSSSNKFSEAQRVFPELVRVEADLPEIQSADSLEIIRAKLKAAQDLGIKNPIVEDTALELECMNGLPGPFIKFFIQKLGAHGLFELAQKDGRCGAAAITTAVLWVDNQEILGIGRVPGTLVSPAGSKGFGFDPIFKPDGFTKTYAELSESEKAQISHRSVAFQELRRRIIS